MKKIFYTTLISLVFISCSTSKNYLSKADDDKTVFDIVKALNKHNDDTLAIKSLPLVYDNALKRHAKKIDIYNTYTGIEKWDKLFNEYQVLQEMFEAIANSGAASHVVIPQSFQNEIDATKNAAAENYYQAGIGFLSLDGRDNAKKAYNNFKKSNDWINGYRDANDKKVEAFNNAIIHVAINPIIDNSFFMNTGWGNFGYNYCNEYFQENLVRDLGGNYASRYPAKFYTDREARRDNINPDWIIDLSLRNIDIPRPSISFYNRTVSKKIQTGTDTSGHSLYQTVYATLQVQKQCFTAHARMEVNITDMVTRKNINYTPYYESFTWEAESATYNGDGRALSNHDWEIINNKNFNQPRKEDVLIELYKKLYPEVRNTISYAVDW